MDTETLHVFGQEAWHDDCKIVGSRWSLFRLAIQAAKTAIFGIPTREVFFVNDGEGYNLIVETTNMDKVPTPYNAEYAQ